MRQIRRLAFPLASSMNLTFFFLFFSPPVLSACNEKGRARKKRNRTRCSGCKATFTARLGHLSRRRDCRTGDRASAKKCRDVAIRAAHHRPRRGPPTRYAVVHLLPAAFTPMRRAITFISIMTGEQLNLHGKSHRPRNEVRPRIRVDRFYRRICVGICMYVAYCV